MVGIKKKHVPGCSCCEESTPVTCDACTGSEAPGIINVTIPSGSLSGICGSCDDYEGTWAVVMTDCTGTVYMGDSCPGGYTLNIWIQNSFGTYYVWVTMRDGASVDIITWRKNYGSSMPDCMAFSSESIAHLANEPASACESDGTAVLITAA